MSPQRNIVMNFINEFGIKYSHLKAAAQFTAKLDVRFYLMGVLVKDGMIAATNGHAALICDAPEVPDVELIIPRETVESLIKKVGNKPREDVLRLRQIDDEFWLIDWQNESFEFFRPVPGKFPDIKRVDISKPTEPPKEFAQWDLNYISAFIKVTKILGITYPLFYPTGKNTSTYVELNDEVHGILMPIRI